MKKLLFFILLAQLVIIGCGKKEPEKEKYTDLKVYLNKVIEMQENSIVVFEKVKSAQDAAAAIESYGKKMVKVAKEGKEIEKKYPHIQLQNKKTQPVELKPEIDKLEKIYKELTSAQKSLMKYMTDPAVVEAMKNLSEELKSTGAAGTHNHGPSCDHGKAPKPK